MKNQYFGDVNDYRKYGLLRQLGGNGTLTIGVCWMLTRNDSGPDGKKTEYLDDDKQEAWKHLDSDLYKVLRHKVHGHETDPTSRNVKHFTDSQLPSAQFFADILTDDVTERQNYFQRMWDKFVANQVALIFFDPDDGLANNNNPMNPKRPGHKGSSKKLE